MTSNGAHYVHVEYLSSCCCWGAWGSPKLIPRKVMSRNASFQPILQKNGSVKYRRKEGSTIVVCTSMRLVIQAALLISLHAHVMHCMT
jgi:hypothetical protein